MTWRDCAAFFLTGVTLAIAVVAGALTVALLAIVLFVGVARGETPRSRETPREFMLLHPCPGGPDAGHVRGRCRGYVRDHIVPLCKNGPDTVENMQWQTVQEGRAKDRWECL